MNLPDDVRFFVDTQPAVQDRVPMAITKWRHGTFHVTADGIKTACGALVPHTATRTEPTVEWYLHTNCFNCAYRLWPQHGPTDYVRPHSRADFPLRKSSPRSTQVTMRIEEIVSPPRKKFLDPQGRCEGSCQSVARVLQEANSDRALDFSARDHGCCYHCRKPVCCECQTMPSPEGQPFCDGCDEDAYGED